MKKTTAGRYHFILIIVCLFVFPACLGPVLERYPRDPAERTVSVYIVSQGWHAGIAIATADIPSDTWIRDDSMPPVRYLEIGWGDQGYYQATDITLGLVLKASFWPNPGTIHVAGFNTPVPDYFAGSDVVEVRISERGMRNMAEFISDAFRTDENDRAIPEGGGLYGTYSFFYEAEEYYYLPKTSNTWTARALRASGAPITPLYAFTSGNVVYQARRIGEVVNP